MPTLLLDRQCLVDHRGTAVRVVCEARTGISDAWCARIDLNADDRYGLWQRVYLRGMCSERDGRPVKSYTGLEPGYYEAHSVLTSKQSQSVYFRVTDRSTIAVLGERGDEDAVIARLNRISVDRLYAARAAARRTDGLPRLIGSVKQVAWAERIRDALLARLRYEPEATRRLQRVRDASWLIAHRDDTVTEILEALRSVPIARRRSSDQTHRWS